MDEQMKALGEWLQAQLDGLRQQRAGHMANANACDGGIQTIEGILCRMAIVGSSAPADAEPGLKLAETQVPEAN